MKFWKFLFGVMIIFLSGCAGPSAPERLYDGALRENKDIARLRVVNPSVLVNAVGQKRVRGAVSEMPSEVHLTPGQYKLQLYINTVTDDGRKIGNGELEVDLLAGRFYTVTYEIFSKDTFAFVLRDHGSQYDERCGVLKSKPNMRIYSNIEVPFGCH